jgi:hypothetical protein
MNTSQFTPIPQPSKIDSVVATIVFYTIPGEKESHCLVRIFSETGKVTVIASEIRSNHKEGSPRISEGMLYVINQVYESIQRNWNVSLDKIVWLEHYGDFSSPDSVGPDAFYQAFVEVVDDKLRMIKCPRYSEEEIEEKLKNLNLEDVYDVLDSIKWTKHLPGVRYSSDEARESFMAARAARLERERIEKENQGNE